MARDEFHKTTIARLANRVGHRCSNPHCRRLTTGPKESSENAVNIGVAAHITAASPGGPRFDSELTPDQRSSFGNGIWLCQFCQKHVDSDETKYTKELLQAWKIEAESFASSLLRVPEKPQGREDPILYIPSTDPTVSWLSFASRATPFVGRDEERERLKEFLTREQKFAWWLVTGPAGAGKSRLALELCRDSLPVWNAGFLARSNGTDWMHFRASRPTLIVVDYVLNRVSEISDLLLLLSRSAQHFASPVRVLLLERDQGSWWSRLLREESLSESGELAARQHDDPLGLGSLSGDALLDLGHSVADSLGTSWTAAAAASYARNLRGVDPFSRPLFAMIVAAYSGKETSTPAVLRVVLKKETTRWSHMIADDEKRRRVENLITLSTLVGGLQLSSEALAFLRTSTLEGLLPRPELLSTTDYCGWVGSPSNQANLPGLQPDILGERFVLDRLREDRSGIMKMLVSASWKLQPDDLCAFVIRATLDFPGDPELSELSYPPTSTVMERVRWGRFVADLIRAVNRSTDLGTQKLLDSLRNLANRHKDESGLHEELARAEFHLGNIFLFTEFDYDRASEQFELAIRHAGRGSAVEASVLNNRGILHHELSDEDQAFADWITVIANGNIPEEARACSLNNRADIFARRGRHDAAIEDRTAVLSLSETSPDRRYIALVRRSRSYRVLGLDNKALEDLDRIVQTDDIYAEQKAQARLIRCAILRNSGHTEDAIPEVTAVIESQDVFPGTHAAAFVELAELARIDRDPARARECLDVALQFEDIDDQTIVEALVVRGRLSLDEGDHEGAQSIWQSILSNPGATQEQRSIAANGGFGPTAG